LSEHSNPIADQYRHRIIWIEKRLEEMANVDGLIIKGDAEAMIYNRYSCSPDAVRRYLRTIQGKGFIELNDTHIIVPHIKNKEKK